MGIPYAEVIGDPIGHSKSPLIHKFWLNKLGLAGDYRAARVCSGEVFDYLEERRGDPDWRGCNATMPLKQELYDLLAIPGAAERDRSGSFNCAFRSPPHATIFGANTDHNGIIEPFLTSPVPIGSVLAIIGSGGAARSAVLTLPRLGFEHIVVIARNQAKARQMLADLEIDGRVQDLDAPLPPAALLVNASPLGMRGYFNTEFDLSDLPADAIVFDMVYDPVETTLLSSARERGLATVDGLRMLIGQARVSFQLFYKELAPPDADQELRELLMR